MTYIDKDYKEASEAIEWYFTESCVEYESLRLDHLDEIGMPEHLLGLLEPIVLEFNTLPENEDLDIYPKSNLINWFHNIIINSTNWDELEVEIRKMLLVICREQ